AACDQKGPSTKGRDTPNVKDPIVVKTKGAPRINKMSGRKRQCSMCRKARHTKRHYTENCEVNMQAEPPEDEKAAELGVDVTCRTWFHLKRLNQWMTHMWKNPGSGQTRVVKLGISVLKVGIVSSQCTLTMITV
ncbi:hypothetical protein HN873_015245, partial [Arachis hypogaea]